MEPPSWLDKYFSVPTIIRNALALPLRSVLEFAGDGVAVSDDPVNKRTIIRIDGIGDTENTELRQAVTELRTTNATPVQIGVTFPIPEDSSVVVDAQLIAIQDGATKTKVFNVRRIFKNQAGTVTALALQHLTGPDELGGALSASVAVLNTAAVGRLEVTGTSAGIRWRLDKQHIRVTAAEAPPVVAFDPLDLPEASGTALLWLDAADCTNTGDGTPVTAVVDKASGTMVVGVTGNEPTFQAANPDYDNGPTFDCAAAQGFILTNTGITGGPWTLVLVCDGTDQVWMQDASGNYLVNAGGGSGDKLQSRADGASLLVGATAVSGVPGVYIIDFDDATSALYTSAETADASGDAGTAASLAGVALGLLGTAAMAGNGLMGSCRHALIYSGKLSAVDRAYLLNGFGDESGITIGP